MPTPAVVDKFKEHVERALDEIRGDESFEEMLAKFATAMEDWFAFSECIRNALDYVCPRICGEGADPICGCIPEDDYFELVDLVARACSGESLE